LENLWNTEDVANFLGKSPQWVRENLVKLGIPTFKVGQQFRFFPSQVQKWAMDQIN